MENVQAPVSGVEGHYCGSAMEATLPARTPSPWCWLTEWAEFGKLDLAEVAARAPPGHSLVDGRNFLLAWSRKPTVQRRSRLPPGVRPHAFKADNGPVQKL